MTFQALFFGGVSLNSLVGLWLWVSIARVQNLRAFSLVSLGTQFLVLCILFVVYSAPLCSLTETHSVSNQSFADDTQLLQSCPPDQIHATVLTIQMSISDMKTWTAQNKLKLNDDKAEALLVKSNRSSLRADTADIPLTTCARNLGFRISDNMSFDKHTSDNMSFDKHISAVCRSAYVKIRRIISIRQYPTLCLCSLQNSFLSASTRLFEKQDTHTHTHTQRRTRGWAGLWKITWTRLKKTEPQLDI